MLSKGKSRTSNSLLRLCASGCVLVAGIGIGKLTADDRIYPTIGGVAVTGTIESITPDKVVIRTRNSPQTFAVNDIQKIYLDGEPINMTNAIDAAADGQWDDAAADLEKVARNSLKGDGVLSEYDFYKAYINAQLALMGKKDVLESANQLHDFHRKNASSYHTFQIYETLGDLGVQLQNFPVAKDFYEKLAEAPFPEYQMRGKYLVAKLMLTQKNAADARKAFTAVLTMNAEGPALNRMKQLQQLARVGTARCDTLEDKPDAALKTLASMIRDNDPTNSELSAAIYNARGEAFAKLGQNELATIAYLHTDLMFAGQPDSHAEALYHLSQLFAKINEPIKASEARNKLQTQYGGSIWLKQK